MKNPFGIVKPGCVSNINWNKYPAIKRTRLKEDKKIVTIEVEFDIFQNLVLNGEYTRKSALSELYEYKNEYEKLKKQLYAIRNIANMQN